MIPNNWKELPLKTSPEFLEEIGFRGTVPSGHPIGVLAAAKNALREHFSKEINKLKVLRQRYCMLYYAGHDPRASDGKIDMEVEWWGPCQEVFSAVEGACRWCLGANHENTKCGCCGTETDTLYVMSQRDNGSWFEKTDGSLVGLNDLLCCYECCDALESEGTGDSKGDTFSLRPTERDTILRFAQAQETLNQRIQNSPPFSFIQPMMALPVRDLPENIKFSEELTGTKEKLLRVAK